MTTGVGGLVSLEDFVWACRYVSEIVEEAVREERETGKRPKMTDTERALMIMTSVSYRQRLHLHSLMDGVLGAFGEEGFYQIIDSSPTLRDLIEMVAQELLGEGESEYREFEEDVSREERRVELLLRKMLNPDDVLN